MNTSSSSKMPIKSIEESVVLAMDGFNQELFPFLPYILQDIWEIGTDPETVITLIKKYFEHFSNLSVLDLGCGKGAVSIRVAQRLKCLCHGIDAIEEFIQFARQKARELEVDEFCKFETGDIREAIHHLPTFNIIILGAIGPVFGDYYQTLTTLKRLLKKDGVIIIDDAYIENDSLFSHPMVLKYNEISNQIQQSGLYLIENTPVTKTEVIESDDIIMESIRRRCRELAEFHPEKKDLFLDYIKKQELESDVNANHIICTTFSIAWQPLKVI